MKLKLNSTAQTHVGRRNNNEDAHWLEPDCGLYIVADGMGGYEGGEVASRLAVESIRDFFKAHTADQGLTWPHGINPELSLIENMISVSVQLANRAIASRRKGKLSQMGSTVAMLVARGRDVIVGHMGDSRVYRLRSGTLSCLTRDHSLYNALIDSGADDLPPEEDFPHGHVITRALGISDTSVGPDLYREQPQNGDVYLLCTDGLLETLDEAYIADLLRRHEPDTACSKLVEEAYRKGGRDNITALVISVVQEA